jgi:hypothetical protein
MGAHVTRPARLRWANALLSCFLYEFPHDLILGDLEEEYSLRARDTSPRSASRWYWGQVYRSIVPLIFVSIRRRAWLVTLGVALATYFLAGIIEFSIGTMITEAFSLNENGESYLSFAIGLVTLTLGGYCAMWVRRGTAAVMSAVVIVVVTVLMATRPESAPLWYALGFLTLGPIATMGGGILRIAFVDHVPTRRRGGSL